MLTTRLIKPSDYERQRWKNGVGETLEIAIDDQNPFRWRISQADLSVSGPLSRFEGYERVIVLLRGGPVDIVSLGKRPRRLSPLTSHKFSGGVDSSVIVYEPAQDFNLFLLGGRATGSVYPTFFPAKGFDFQFPLAGDEHFLFCVRGHLKVIERNLSQEFFLAERETLRLTRSSRDEEFLNVKVVADSDTADLMWVVVHVEAQAEGHGGRVD